MNKFICIHGHFYQPPRENPWLEEIELQDSAFPYANWNKRITDECYAPNVASRILGSEGKITDIVNNYSKISFNFGPTLLSWMEREEPDIYLAILKADKSSQHFFNGHGGAIAQAYNHMIMPLANARDKQTQVIWGIRDFEYRFKREPEGMWLPETAVDMETLEILAQYGIRFTILAPYQAKAFRKIDEKDWTVVKDAGGVVDCQQPYICRLPSGRSIVIFFYDGPISHDIAFSGLLGNGEAFAGRLFNAAAASDERPRLVNVATDGETYGHHHRFGNMALSYCLHYIEQKQAAVITVFGEYLEKHPPEHEVEIVEQSSWSCSHGVERWRSNCGCCIGGHAGWDQKWRKPLRKSLDWLRDQLVVVYEQAMAEYSDDPWSMRNNYISVILDRSGKTVDRFLKTNCKRPLSESEVVRVLKLLEMQRNGMLMYTSCGWFFDELSGIETVQIMQYAARAIQLAKDISGVDLEKDFLIRLEEAPSNVREYQNGRVIYEQQVKPSVTSLLDVGAHFAISCLFDQYPQAAEIYCYHIELRNHKFYEFGKQKFSVGQLMVKSNVTFEEVAMDFAALHFGDYNVSGGVRLAGEDREFSEMTDALKKCFEENNITDVIQLMNEFFGRNRYNLWDLFKNEQGKVLEQIFDQTLQSIENNFRAVYEHYYPLMQVRPDFRIPLPKALAMSVEFILNRDLVNELQQEHIDFERLERIAQEIKRWSFTRDKDALNFAASTRLNQFMARLTQHSRDVGLLSVICEFLRILQVVPLEPELWRAQNIYFSMLQRLYPKIKRQRDTEDPGTREWVKNFERLGSFLKVDFHA